MKTHLIVNPTSASGRTGRHFDRVASAVRAALGDFEVAFTTGPGDATRLAREAAAAGSPLVVAVGGDGTVNEVVEGLASAASRPAFGLIPWGTGGDFKRTIGCPDDFAAAARVLAEGAEQLADLGLVEYQDAAGRRAVRHFVNVAGFGISGQVVRNVGQLGKRLGGRATYLIGAARALMSWRDQPVRWRADGGAWNDARLTALSVCNGRYFGGGMLVAPDAAIDDGLFDLTVWQDLGFVDLVVKRPMLYDGRHVELPNTSRLRARTVEAEPLDGARVLLDVDGDAAGTLPARFSLVPGALRIRVPRTR